MPVRRDIGRNSSYRQGIDSDIRGASAVAAIWLVFYVLALGVTITSVLFRAQSKLLPDDCGAVDDNSPRASHVLRRTHRCIREEGIKP